MGLLYTTQHLREVCTPGTAGEADNLQHLN